MGTAERFRRSKMLSMWVLDHQPSAAVAPCRLPRQALASGVRMAWARAWRGMWTALGMLLLGFGAGSPAHALSVTFINPGMVGEAYWLAASQAMDKAARSLGMELEVLHAGRDPVRAVELARGLAARPPAQRPAYLVLTNDYGAAPDMLNALDEAGILVVMAFSSVHGVQREQTGEPRTRHPFWLGSLTPDMDEAGYLTARRLIARARAADAGVDAKGMLQLLVICGDRSTPSSLARLEGMQRAVREDGRVTLLQTVYADWGREKAREQALWLFRRYPQAWLVWSANDQIAFGAMDAARALGHEPGKTAWFSGINTSAEAFASLRRGDMAALAGGHFMVGAWALVMIYDHAHGADFLDEGLEITRPMVIMFDPDLADRFTRRVADPSAVIDFRRYSKALNPRLRRYSFDLRALLR